MRNDDRVGKLQLNHLITFPFQSRTSLGRGLVMILAVWRRKWRNETASCLYERFRAGRPAILQASFISTLSSFIRSLIFFFSNAWAEAPVFRSFFPCQIRSRGIVWSDILLRKNWAVRSKIPTSRRNALIVWERCAVLVPLCASVLRTAVHPNSRIREESISDHWGACFANFSTLPSSTGSMNFFLLSSRESNTGGLFLWHVLTKPNSCLQSKHAWEQSSRRPLLFVVSRSSLAG